MQEVTNGYFPLGVIMQRSQIIQHRGEPEGCQMKVSNALKCDKLQSETIHILQWENIKHKKNQNELYFFFREKMKCKSRSSENLNESSKEITCLCTSSHLLFHQAEQTLNHYHYHGSLHLISVVICYMESTTHTAIETKNQRCMLK